MKLILKGLKHNIGLASLLALSAILCHGEFLLAQADTSPALPTVQEKIEFRRKTLRTMRDDLVQTAAFVQSAQFASAQESFAKALKKWYIFGGTVKRIAPESYAKISPGFEAVKKGLHQSAIPLSTLKSDLQHLIQDVNIAVPISDAQE
jgi:hypothetical protein